MPSLLPGHYPKTISQAALFLLAGGMILAFLLVPGALPGIDLSYQTATPQPTKLLAGPRPGISLPAAPPSESVLVARSAVPV